MHIVKRILAICLSLSILMMTCARAEIDFLVHSKDFDWQSTPVKVWIKAAVEKHMPFDDERFATLKPLLDMMSIQLVTGEDSGLVTIFIDEYEALSLQQQDNLVRLSTMQDTVFTAQNDPVSMLLGEDVSIASGYDALGMSEEGESLITHGAALINALPDALSKYGKRSTNTTNIVGYGKAAYRIDYTIQANKSQDFHQILLAHCPEGWLNRILSSIAFSGKRTLRMYFTAEDVLLRAEYNGACGPEGDVRTVKLIFKCQYTDTFRKDYVELTSPAKKGNNKNNLTFERVIQMNDQGHCAVEGNFTYSVIHDGISDIRKGAFDLINACTENADVITGSLTLENKLNDAEKYSALTVIPNLSISVADSLPCINGTLTITEQYAGKTTEHAVLTIDLQPAEQLQWQSADLVTDLDALSADALIDIQQDVAMSVATAIVHPLILMLGADAQYFFRELPEDAVQNILDAAEMSAN